MTVSSPAYFEKELDRHPKPEWGPTSLWAGMIGSGLVWLFQLQLMYLLVPWCCRTQRHWPLHVATIVLLLAVLACGFLCWRDYERTGRTEGDTEAGEPAARTHFRALVGVMAGVLFSLLVIAQGIATFFIDPCWT